MFKMFKARITNILTKTNFSKTYKLCKGLKNDLKTNKSFITNQQRYFSTTSENDQNNSKVNFDDKLHIIDINPANKKIKVPFHCSVFQLAQILNVDMIDLVNKYKETINQDIVDAMEYLPRDDLELFLLENGIDFEIEEHHSKMIKRPMVVTIMGHVDHGKYYHI